MTYITLMIFAFIGENCGQDLILSASSTKHGNYLNCCNSDKIIFKLNKVWVSVEIKYFKITIPEKESFQSIGLIFSKDWV